MKHYINGVSAGINHSRNYIVKASSTEKDYMKTFYDFFTCNQDIHVLTCILVRKHPKGRSKCCVRKARRGCSKKISKSWHCQEGGHSGLNQWLVSCPSRRSLGEDVDFLVLQMMKYFINLDVNESEVLLFSPLFLYISTKRWKQSRERFCYRERW